MVDISMNRPVHLAQRDAYYKCAIELLEGRHGETSIAKKRERIAMILVCLNSARNGAVAALRGYRGGRSEKMFAKYLELVCDAARAALVMVQHESLLREEKGFLKQFLSESIARLIQFEKIGRSVEEILDRIAEIVLYSSATYSQLKKANVESLSPADQVRYGVAYEAVIQQRRARRAARQPAGLELR